MRDLCDVGTVQCLDYGGGHMNLQSERTIQKLIYTHSFNTSASPSKTGLCPVVSMSTSWLLLHYSCYHWGKLGKVRKRSLCIIYYNCM